VCRGATCVPAWSRRSILAVVYGDPLLFSKICGRIGTLSWRVAGLRNVIRVPTRQLSTDGAFPYLESAYCDRSGPFANGSVAPAVSDVGLVEGDNRILFL